MTQDQRNFFLCGILEATCLPTFFPGVVQLSVVGLTCWPIVTHDG